MTWGNVTPKFVDIPDPPRRRGSFEYVEVLETVVAKEPAHLPSHTLGFRTHGRVASDLAWQPQNSEYLSKQSEVIRTPGMVDRRSLPRGDVVLEPEMSETVISERLDASD
jgi:hypothetical protein